MRYIKILLSTMFFITIFFSLSGCESNDKTIADSEGNILCYSMQDIYDDGNNGFYVKNTNNTFSPVMSGMYHYSKKDKVFLNKSESADRFIWFSDTTDIKLKNLIPVVTDKTPLVGFFNENNKLPETINFEKYQFSGYTIGCTFSMSEDQSSMILNANESCPDSIMNNYISEENLEGQYEIVKFNESETLPIRNIDKDTGLLLGLEKNKKYQIGYYDGTKYKSTHGNEFDIVADTQVFRSQGDTDLELPFSKSTNQYFEINIPDNLEEGYYYIANYGLFKYEP